MADNFRQTSLVIPRLTAAEEKWLVEELRRLQREAEASDDPDYVGWPLVAPDKVVFLGGPEDEEYGRHLWIASGEWADVCAISNLLYDFLRRWRPKGYLTFTYADTCSRPRVGEFGGGAVFCTAAGITSLHTDGWVDEAQRAWKGRNKRRVKSRKGRTS